MKCKYILLTVLGSSLLGCGSGANNLSASNSSNNTNPNSYSPNPVHPEAKSSVISHDYINALFTPKVLEQGSTVITKATASGGCGSILGDTSFALGFLSFIPVVGTVLGPIDSIMSFIGGGDSSACIQNEFAQINQQLQQQQSEINSLPSRVRCIKYSVC